jgi:membrane-bound lytic murein transglycosylase D
VANAKMNRSASMVSAAPRPVVPSDLPDNQYVYHTVRSGENLWTIAQQYPGVTNEDILRLNNIRDARKLQPGQKLKIKPRS